MPAFSGITQRLHAVLGGDYLAGIWSSDVNSGLLWHREMRHAAHVQQYRAPSWSWAVTDEPVLFDCRGWTLSPLDMVLVDYSTTPRDRGNPYGEIEAGHLTVRGLTQRLVRSRQVVRTVFTHYDIGSVEYDQEEDGGENEELMKSRSALHMAQGVDSAYLLSVRKSVDSEYNWDTDSEVDWEIDFEAWSSQQYVAFVVCAKITAGEEGGDTVEAQCLVLQPVADGPDNVYERVGFLKLDSARLQWLESWPSQTLTLV